MDVLGSTGQVELNLFRTQLDEERQVRALASGLRVVSASDDPSGLAISENIQTKVAGLQQGVQNVQTASNLLTVADSTLANVERILSRVHVLIVEASSDLNSNSQLESIQTEIETLLQEVNKIAGQASFNGIKLLDGSLATSMSAGYNSSPYAVQVTPFDQGTGSSTVYDATGSGTPNSGPLMSAPTNGNPMYGGNSAGFVSGLTEIKILGYSTNPVDPNLGPLGAPGVYVQIIQYSTDPAFGGTNGATEQISTAALFTGTGINQGGGSASPISISSANGMQNFLLFNLANLSQQDVGVAQAFETFDASPSSSTSGQALQVNDSGNEGGNVQISLPSVTTSALGISSISVLQPNAVDWANNPTGTVSNAAATADAEGRVQNAMDLINQARAQVGAQGVALQDDMNDASLEVVNQVASESAIRDVNVGQAVTQFTKDQVLSQVGMSVLAQMQTSAQLVVQLVNGLNPGTHGKV